MERTSARKSTRHDGMRCLLAELRSHVYAPGTAPDHAANLVGSFVEAMNTSLEKLLGVSLAVDSWHVELPRCLDMGPLHPGVFADLSPIRHMRNAGSHNTSERLNITLDRVQAKFCDLARSSDRLLEMLEDAGRDNDFLDILESTQEVCRNQRDAHALLEILRQVEPLEPVLDAILSAAAIALGSRWDQIQQISHSYGRLRKALGSLASLNTTAGCDHLLDAGFVALSNLEDSEFEPILRRWIRLRSGNDSAELRPEKMNVIRIVVERSEDQRGAWLIRRAEMVQPRLAQPPSLGRLPRQFARLDELISQGIVDIAARLLRAHRQTCSGDGLRPEQVVLQLEVPYELACERYDTVVDPFLDASPTNDFRCFAVRPRIPGRYPVTLERAVGHPHQPGSNSLALETPLSTRELGERLRGFDCLFAGKNVWDQGEPVSPIIRSFRTYPCAILHAQETVADDLMRLFRGADWCGLPSLFDRIAEARRAGERYVVFWDDDEYDGAADYELIPLAMGS